MSNFDSSLRECFGFSHIIISDSPRVFTALELISPRFPIGVETMYKPFFIKTSLVFFILLASCAPVNNITKDINDETNTVVSTEISIESSAEQENIKLEENNLENDFKDLFTNLLNNQNLQSDLSKNIKKFIKLNATSDIVDEIEKML